MARRRPPEGSTRCVAPLHTRDWNLVCRRLRWAGAGYGCEGLGVNADGDTTWSTSAPLRFRVFRWLWLASRVSNVGSRMQGVGAQWFPVALWPSQGVCRWLRRPSACDY
jgi:hypothetical protein